ncbi:hypothetical protein EX30DRAFT_305738 [Ascodesmis nigricans]|uniref:Uncharacterized protein n=1 Tax=Ascodesmis nigricans TaxID=341454 RepID=A0A4S2MYW0_9PEZI|nr:hypothetical protein EX30DRAFT_305738 [Ascodesmis nigricans]
MAAPKDMTTLDISGVFYMNKSLGDDLSEVFVLQGMSWITRKALGVANITLHISHKKNDAGVEVIDIDQTLSGGIKGTSEHREMDYEERGHEDHIFGKVVGKSRRLAIADVKDDHLRSGFPEELNAEGLIESIVENAENDWIAHQVWGFENIGGEKRYVRHLVLTCPNRGKRLEKKMVYDYKGPLN